MPALHRYTGVLYDALDVGSLRGRPRCGRGGGWSWARRCSGCSRRTTRCPRTGCLRARRCPGAARSPRPGDPVLEPLLAAVAARELVVDLRSGSYAAMARVPGAVTVTVRTAGGAIVSHFNKAHKGRLARVLVSYAGGADRRGWRGGSGPARGPARRPPRPRP